MPYVVRSNRSAIEDKMARIGRALELEKQNFDGVFDWLLKFRAEVEIMNTLGDMKVPEGDADEIGERAVQDPCAGANPIQHNAATYTSIFRKALTGDLS